MTNLTEGNSTMSTNASKTASVIAVIVAVIAGVIVAMAIVGWPGGGGDTSTPEEVREDSGAFQDKVPDDASETVEARDPVRIDVVVAARGLDSFDMLCGTCQFAMQEFSTYRSDFSDSFLNAGESCSYAPSMLVDNDTRTGWVEGDAGVGIGAEVIVPAIIDLNRPVRIWAGYGKSTELFVANARPKRILVTVLRLRREPPDPHDMLGCSEEQYTDPVAVAAHEIDLLDYNGYQALPVPEFEVEYYMDYPIEWHRMDGEDRRMYQERVDRGLASPYREQPTEYTYLLKLTILEAYPGIRYEDTVISEVGNETL